MHPIPLVASSLAGGLGDSGANRFLSSLVHAAALAHSRNPASSLLSSFSAVQTWFATVCAESSMISAASR